MRTPGLIGGMSWESTLPYYRLVNERVRERLGGLHSAKLLLYSVDFAEVEALQHAGDWDAAGDLLVDAACRLQRGGAEAIAICTNTMHLLAPRVEAAVDLPLLHIADATAQAVKGEGVRDVALLGTRFTMEQPFYRERLEAQGLHVRTPEQAERETIHRVIYDELCRGQVLDASREAFQRIIDRLVAAGAAGVVLGCTEIGLLVGHGQAPVPLFDTTAIHARATADWALGAG